MAGQPDAPRVAIVYGSPTDGQVLSKAGATLERFGVGYEEATLSAERSPRALADWVAGLEARGIEVVIAGAGLSAALPGAVAAQTVLPVIGVPIHGGALGGLEALLALARMPPGVPVASVGVDNATNAAVLAVQMLAAADPDLRTALSQFKDDFEKAALVDLARQ